MKLIWTNGFGHIPAVIISNSTIETIEKGVKYVQN